MNVSTFLPIHFGNANTQECESKGPQVQSQPVLHTKFQVSLSHIVGLYLKIKTVASEMTWQVKEFVAS